MGTGPWKDSGGTGGGVGPQGPRGLTGPAGADGSVLLEGTGVPSNANGTNKDYYLNIATGDWYHKGSGSWVLQGNLKGPSGAAGTAGTAGADGTPGSLILSGAGVPSAGTGTVRDYYLNTTTSDWYYKGSGSWVLQTNLKGATGPQGSAGTPGSNGAAGAAGSSAYQVAVAAGFVGTQAAWLASLVGSQGPAGPKGDTGDVGPIGPKGDTGDVGPAGPAGSGYTLPSATNLVLGGVKQGANVTIDGSGVISVAAPVTSLPFASITSTPTTLAGYGITDAQAALGFTPYNSTNPSGYQTAAQVSSAISAAAYSLPIATGSVLGGVKQGSGVTIAGDGTISATGGSGSSIPVLYNSVARYQMVSITGQAVWCVSSSTAIPNVSWTRSTTDLTMSETGHNHQVGERAIIRGTNLSYQVSLITAITANSWTVTTADTGASSGSAAHYMMGFTYAHNAGAGSITGGTLTAPTSGEVQLISIRLHMAANIRTGTTYTITVPPSALNGAGADSTGMDDVYVPLQQVRQDANSLVAVGNTIAAFAGSNWAAFQFAALPAAATGIHIFASF